MNTDTSDNDTIRCSVPNCNQRADFEVLLFDVYPQIGDVFLEADRTCPTICEDHLIENEARAEGTREPRGVISYPFTNRRRAQGFSTYRRLAAIPSAVEPAEEQGVQ